MKITRRQLAAAPLAAVPALEAQLAAPVEAPEWKVRWIWFPEGRTQNGTFVTFRRSFTLGWLACSVHCDSSPRGWPDCSGR